MSLMKRFYEDPYLQLRSTLLNLLASLLLCIVIYKFHSADFYRMHFMWTDILLIPLGLYAGGVSVVFIHNATHKSFPWHWLNQFCGYLSGMHQLWGYTGWQLIHLVHHQYVDDDDMDPHNHTDLTFWQFCLKMPFRSNAKIRERYREHWGAGMRTRLFQSKFVFSLSSVALVLGNLLFWFMLLGPAGFLFFYIPSFISNYMLVADINYAAHPADPETGEIKAVNLDHTLYYNLANAMWSGIYYHANHHRKPLLYNPQKMSARRPVNTRHANLAA